MNQHPDPDDEDAPLFCSIRSRDEGDRLTSHAVYTVLQRTTERSDVDNTEYTRTHYDTRE